MFRLGSALECCDLTQYGIEHELLAQCFMPNIGGIIAVSYVESQFEFNLISPSVLDYSVIDGTEPAESMLTVNEYIAEDYWFAVNGSSLPENLQGVRSRADEISENTECASCSPPSVCPHVLLPSIRRPQPIKWILQTKPHQ